MRSGRHPLSHLTLYYSPLLQHSKSQWFASQARFFSSSSSRNRKKVHRRWNKHAKFRKRSLEFSQGRKAHSLYQQQTNQRQNWDLGFPLEDWSKPPLHGVLCWHSPVKADQRHARLQGIHSLNRSQQHRHPHSRVSTLEGLRNWLGSAKSAPRHRCSTKTESVLWFT